MTDENPYKPPASDQFDINDRLERIAATTTYPVEAFVFVLRGVDFAHTHIHDLEDGKTLIAATGRPHLTGQELSWCFHDYAMHLFMENARATLADWNIFRTQDFGGVVEALTKGGLMTESPEDKPSDFDDVFDFDDEFNPDDFAGTIVFDDD